MIKNVLIKMELEGNGIVNRDSSGQKYIIDAFDIKNLKGHKSNNNVLYAKKNFYKDEDGNVSYKIKISRDALMHDIFKNDIISQNPNVVHHDASLYSYIASPISILRGYLFANKTETIKRDGVITLCDAEQTDGALSSIEVCSRSGQKEEDKDVVDNSLFFKETVGDIKYLTTGNLDLTKLQFITCDNVFGRYSFNPDKFGLFKEFLTKNLPNFSSELDYYQLTGSAIDIPEYGVLLSNENVIFLVKEALKRMLGLNIKRKDAYARVSSLKIKFVENPLEDIFNNEYGWIELRNEQDVDSLDFEPQSFYNKVDLEEAKKLRKAIEDKKKEVDKVKIDDKKKKEEQKKNRSNKTESNDE